VFGRDLDHSFQVTVHQQTGECIGMDGLHAVGVKLGRREIVEVERDDVVGPNLDGYGQDVTVVRVREGEAFDVLLVPVHTGVREGTVHFASGIFEIVPGHVRAISMDVARPLAVNVVAPVGPHEIVHGQPEQEIPQVGGIEDVGIVYGDRARIHQ
jgi:hypothetical protein